jgi:hypothetical protein
MPTDVTGLRIEREKTQTETLDAGASIALLCMACLVGALVLLSCCFGAPDLSEIAQSIGP